VLTRPAALIIKENMFIFSWAEVCSMDDNPNMAFFYREKGSMLVNHKNEYIVIADSKVYGYYPSYSVAFNAVIKQYDIGDFIIQRLCENDEDVFTFYSPIFS